MRNKILLINALAFTVLMACNSNVKDTESTISESDVTSGTMIAEDSSSQTMTPPVEIAGTVPSEAPADGLNPAHGLPGHRCDLAVGALLSSAPAPAPDVNNITLSGDQMQIQGATEVQTPPASTPATQQPRSIMSAPATIDPAGTPATTTTAPGMNPPHGQPGHDCAVAVGAPLKK